MWKRLFIIKYWTKSLIKKTKQWIKIDKKNIKKHCKIINKINWNVILITSWAIIFGEIKLWKFLNTTWNNSKKILSTYWNPILYNIFSKNINKKILNILMDEKNFEEKHRENIFNNILSNKNIIPQINWNDILPNNSFSDNDYITKSLIKIIWKDFDEISIIFNTNTDWILNNNNETINEIHVRNFSLDKIKKLCNKKYSLWIWWMESKILNIKSILTENTHKNIKVYIINWKKPNELKKISKNKKIFWSKVIY